MPHTNAREAWHRGISTGGMLPLHYSIEWMVGYWMHVSRQCKDAWLRCVSTGGMPPVHYSIEWMVSYWIHASYQGKRCMAPDALDAVPPCINSPSRGEIIVCISYVNERTTWHQCSGTGDNTFHALIHRGDSKDLHTPCAGGANGYSKKMCELRHNGCLSYWLPKQFNAKQPHKVCLLPIRHTLRRGRRIGEPSS